DGALTTALVPLDELADRWPGLARFDDLARSAAGLRLLKVNTLSIGDEAERPYASLGHDALAKVVASWDDDLRRGARLRRVTAAAAAAMALALVMAALAGFAESQRRHAAPGRQRSYREWPRAEGEKARAEKERDRAYEYLARTLQTLDTALIGLADVQLVDVPQMVRRRRSLLDESRKGYVALLERYEKNAGGGP